MSHVDHESSESSRDGGGGSANEDIDMLRVQMCGQRISLAGSFLAKNPWRMLAIRDTRHAAEENMLMIALERCRRQ